MANINEHDLDSRELISALKSIEMESTSAVELQMMREENRRLWDELTRRHQMRLTELQTVERKKYELLQVMETMKNENKEIITLKSNIILTHHNLDQARNLLFQISFGFTFGERIDQVFAKLQQLNQMIQDCCVRLGATRSSEETLVIQPETKDMDCSKSVVMNDTRQKHQEVNTLLDEIQAFDFESIV